MSATEDEAHTIAAPIAGVGATSSRSGLGFAISG